jgi:heat shock protein HslJ
VKRVVFLTSILFASVIVMGCDSSTTSEEVDLEDIDWVMESYGEAGSLKAALPFPEVTLYFDSAEGVCKGNAGINHYGSNYQLDGSELLLPEGVVTTCLGGNAAVLWQEEEYIGILSAADSFEIVDGKLHIYSNGNEIVCHKK